MGVVVAAILVVLIVVAAMRVTFALSGPSWRRRRRRRGDDVLFEYCSTRWWSSVRGLNRRLPRDPRCRLCYAPFAGFGRIAGIRPSRKNPLFCTSCFEAAPMGGRQLDIGVLFADLRGFTSVAESMSPEAVADLLHRFYDTAVSALMPRDAIIDKFEGDSVMALFLPSFPSLGEGTVDVMMAAGIDLLKRVGSDVGRHDLAIGVGLHFGPAFVGNVGSGEVKDFTAVGDVVNTAQRLQSAAEGGEIVISQDAFTRLTSSAANAVEVSLQLKGKDQPLRAWRVRVNA